MFPAIILEYLPQLDLLSYLKNSGKSLELNEFLEIAKGAAAVMLHVELSGYVHSDLSARNILLTREGTNFKAKISDFGLSEKVSEITTRTKLPFRWSSPEFIKTKVPSVKSDVWSFGVMLWEMLTREQPFAHIKSNREVAVQILKGERLKLIHGPNEILQLIEKCWNSNPHLRPNFSTLYLQLVEIEKKLIQVTNIVREPIPNREMVNPYSIAKTNITMKSDKPAKPKPKCAVFISYSWYNSTDAKKNGEVLNCVGKSDPRYISSLLDETGEFNCWLDKKMSGGIALFDDIAQGILNAQVFIPFISDEYAESENCKNELIHAIKLKKAILPVIVGVKTNKWVTSTVALLINKYLYIDMVDDLKLEQLQYSIIAKYNIVTETTPKS